MTIFCLIDNLHRDTAPVPFRNFIYQDYFSAVYQTCTAIAPAPNKNCDSLIREISKFVSLDNLFEMYDWFGNHSPQNSQNDKFEIELRDKLQELREKAKNDGWEI